MPKIGWLAAVACVLGVAGTASADEWSHRYALKGHAELLQRL